MDIVVVFVVFFVFFLVVVSDKAVISVIYARQKEDNSIRAHDEDQTVR